MNKFFRLTSLAAMTGLLISSSAFSAVTVYPMSVKMNQQGAGQIKIISGSKQTEYVKATVKKIENPGTKQEKERVLSQSESKNLIITPSKFGLASGTTRITRLVNMIPPTKEQVYRVYFDPIQGLDNEKAPDSPNSSSKVGINISWGALIFVPPVTPEINFTLDAQKKAITNTGNLHIELTRIGVCPEKNSDAGCTWEAITKKIYPDQTFTLPASFKTSLKGVVKVEYRNWVDKKMTSKVFSLS
ncbi:pilus assembly protein PapD [Scandinavium goeteborgense]|uniref:pilus assembly protein PapD n=1 Tax=Scandinavium goeteborgense TaxID=1851514 RepID=UPI000F65A3B5|nr:pilus assembly protein PapD [Scandinavium goeteborgense]QKN81607.1 pilus assembly protein PapD [Scandinavium goeteborgense]